MVFVDPKSSQNNCPIPSKTNCTSADPGGYEGVDSGFRVAFARVSEGKRSLQADVGNMEKMHGQSFEIMSALNPRQVSVSQQTRVTSMSVCRGTPDLFTVLG